MTNAQALRRAKRAIEKAKDDSDSFGAGGMASRDIMEALTEALEQEFRWRSLRDSNPRSSP